MKMLFILLLFIVSQLFAIIGSVMYGDFIALKEAPYFVSLLSRNRTDKKFYCGGSIISEYWIITAAHCMQVSYDRISTGESIPNLHNGLSTYDIEKIFVYGSYTTSSEGRDVALIKLKEPIELNEYRQPIKIRKIPPRGNDLVTLLGFGDQGAARGMAPVLRKTEVRVISECLYMEFYKGLKNVAFCAGNGTTDTCPGDSGSPAVIDGQLAGLVSFGPRCFYYKYHPRAPAVYTRVDRFYDWIIKITGIDIID